MGFEGKRIKARKDIEIRKEMTLDETYKIPKYTKGTVISMEENIETEEYTLTVQWDILPEMFFSTKYPSDSVRFYDPIEELATKLLELLK